MKVLFQELGLVEDSLIKYAVIVTRYQDKWIFCRHKNRTTWEIPGGHRESGETPMEAAYRELYEETGATNVIIQAVGTYKLNDYGLLCYGQVTELRPIPEYSEISEICLAEQLPENLTYSAHKQLFSYANHWINGYDNQQKSDG